MNYHQTTDVEATCRLNTDETKRRFIQESVIKTQPNKRIDTKNLMLNEIPLSYKSGAFKFGLQSARNTVNLRLQDIKNNEPMI